MSSVLNHNPLDANAPIGVFDSGLGGLRVLDRLMTALPEERFVYLGDTLHMPYGHKTQAEIQHYFATCMQWLVVTHGIKLMVVACNTAAAVASETFADYAPLAFVDPVTPISRWLVMQSYRSVGIMATPATVASNRYTTVLDGLNSTIDLHPIGCENLATVIEEGGVDSPACHHLLNQYIPPLLAQRVEAIVLGCTHYPYAHDAIARLTPGVDILDPDIYMVADVRKQLERQGLQSTRHTGRMLAEVDYFVTSQPEKFYENSRQMPFQAIAMKPPTPVILNFSIPESAAVAKAPI